MTYTLAGSSCACVWPVEVRLRFSISPYTFFSLVSELAEEIAAGIPLNRSQVRIMGADAADHQLEKTTVLINLVPLDETFKAASAFSIYKKFWNRELSIKPSKFGVYEVLYIRYPGNFSTVNLLPYNLLGYLHAKMCRPTTISACLAL